jgi:hypothetical protein
MPINHNLCRKKDSHKASKGQHFYLTPINNGTLNPPDIVPPKPVPERPVPVEKFLQYVMDHQSQMQLYQEEFGVNLSLCFER